MVIAKDFPARDGVVPLRLRTDWRGDVAESWRRAAAKEHGALKKLLLHGSRPPEVSKLTNIDEYETCSCRKKTRYVNGPDGGGDGEGEGDGKGTGADVDGQERITRLIDLSRVVIHYGYLPLILYIGYTRSDPKPALIKYVSALNFVLFW